MQLSPRMQHGCAASFLVCAWVMAEAVSHNCTRAVVSQRWTMVSMAEPTLVSHEYVRFQIPELLSRFYHVQHVYAEVITVLLFDCLLLQLYLISPAPVVPVAVDQFDTEIISLANTSTHIL